jgi:ribosomal protein S18 acetylase RimI-like enzyme
MQIRQANDHDCESIVRFVRATLHEMASVGGHDVNSDERSWRRYGENLAEDIQKRDRLYLLAQTGSSVVGYLEGEVINLQALFTPKKCFHISVVYVIPEYRQRGIATSLVKEALRWASVQGCREADLHVLVNNENARRLYRKIGFTKFQYELRMKLLTTP